MSKYVAKNDDERNINFYSSLLKKFGQNYNSLNWGSKSSQFKRFEVLASVGINTKDKILDLGCGLGDFYSWLSENIPFVDYHGIDLTYEMVKETRKRYPELLIENKTIFEIDAEKPVYDYIVASGIFYLRKDEPYEYMMKTIGKMFQLCKKGIAFNSLSSWSKEYSKNEFYADPLEIVAEIKNKFTSKIILRHDYHPNDFSIYMYKEEKI